MDQGVPKVQQRHTPGTRHVVYSTEVCPAESNLAGVRLGRQSILEINPSQRLENKSF